MPTKNIYFPCSLLHQEHEPKIIDSKLVTRAVVWIKVLGQSTLTVFI